MIAGYPIDDVPFVVPPYKSIVGTDFCSLPQGNYFETDRYNIGDDYAYPLNLVDMGTHYLFDNNYSGARGLIIKREFTDKEYIELLYSLRNWKLIYNASSTAWHWQEPHASVYNVNLNADLYPTYQTDFHDHPELTTIAPPARCLVNNALNNYGVTNFGLRNDWLINSLTGATFSYLHLYSELTQDGTSNFIRMSLPTPFPRRVSVYETDYVNGNTIYDSIFNYADDKTPFGFIGNYTLIYLPFMEIFTGQSDSTNTADQNFHYRQVVEFGSPTTGGHTANNSAYNIPFNVEFMDNDYTMYANSGLGGSLFGDLSGNGDKSFTADISFKAEFYTVEQS